MANNEREDVDARIKNSFEKYKCYEITDRGRDYYHNHDVNPVHGGMKPMVRIHDYRLKGDVNPPLPMNHMGEWKVYMPRGWKGYTKKYSDESIGTVTVNLTSESATLFFSIIKANSLDEAETKLSKAVGWLVRDLADESIFITNLRQNRKGSYASVYDPIAKRYFEHKITYDGATFSIDHSHGHPETEFHSKVGFGRYQKFVSFIESGKIDPDKLAEMCSEAYV